MTDSKQGSRFCSVGKEDNLSIQRFTTFYFQISLGCTVALDPARPHGVKLLAISSPGELIRYLKRRKITIPPFKSIDVHRTKTTRIVSIQNFFFSEIDRDTHTRTHERALSVRR